MNVPESKKARTRLGLESKYLHEWRLLLVKINPEKEGKSDKGRAERESKSFLSTNEREL